MTEPTPKLIEIFRAGKHTDVNGNTREFTQADIAAIAESYDAASSEAPLVVGHPKINAPAYGWVQGLSVDGDVLLAKPHQVDAEFADMVNAGRFKKRSASFFLPDSPGNPKPGQFYLRHVGFLGGAAPAVKGLREFSFADDSGYIEFSEDSRWYSMSQIAGLFRGLRDWLIEKDGLETADRVIADWQIQNIQDAARPPSDAANLSYSAPGVEPLSNDKDTDMTDKTAEFAERESALQARQQEIADREAKVAESEAKVKRTEVTEFASALVTEGKLLPKDKATAIELLLAMPADATLSFADGDNNVSKPAAELMRDFLTGLPKIISFAEKSGGENATIDFADSAAIAQAATEFKTAESAAGREISTAQAVQHITKGNK